MFDARPSPSKALFTTGTAHTKIAFNTKCHSRIVPHVNHALGGGPGGIPPYGSVHKSYAARRRRGVGAERHQGVSVGGVRARCHMTLFRKYVMMLSYFKLEFI